MKVLIWAICLLVGAFIQVLCLDYNGITGALPKIVVYGAVYAVARFLCKKYEEKRARKSPATIIKKETVQRGTPVEQERKDLTEKAEITHTKFCPQCSNTLPEDSEFCHFCGAKLDVLANSHDVDSNETSPPEPKNVPIMISTEEATSQKAETPASIHIQPVYQVDTRKNQKKRYCKYCGGVVSSETKKCTSCGKQYFRLPKYLGTGLLAVLSVALVGLNVYQYVQGEALRKELEEAMEKIETQKVNITDRDQIIYNYKQTIKKLERESDTRLDLWLKAEPKARFLDDHVVIIGDSNNKYHKFGCEDLDLSYFYAYNTENAISQGYRACNKCN